jgi:hypothetical protein
VRESARLAMTASPSAPPIMNDVLTTPDARPASRGSTSPIAASRIGLKPIPAPRPWSTMPGRMSTAKLASTGARAKSRIPTAMSERPARSGGLMPKRITSLSDSAKEAVPQITVDGRYARPTSSGV